MEKGETMSEENKMIYCTQCGSENSAESKFCSNCGSKLEKAAAPKNEEQPAQTEGIFSGEEAASAYEKITDAEEEKPTPIPSYQEEIKINYNTEPQGYGTDNSSNVYDSSSQRQYYAAENNADKQEGGNIGFAIASLICGIVSLVCCCFTLFSAILAIAAVVLGIITLCFKYDGKGMAIAGIVTGGIGLLIVIFAMIISGSSAYNDYLYELLDELNY